MATELNIIRLRLAEISKAKQALEEEEKELHIAERVLARLSKRQTEATPVEATVSGKITQAQMVISALENVEPMWVQSSSALHELVQKQYGVDIGQGSFKPLLSDLKKRNIIMRDDEQRIALSSRVRDFILS